MPDCKFCGRSDRPLVNAHIIPRSFFRIVRADAKYSVAVKAQGNALVPHFTQAGFADKNILCESCEKLFTPWDTYGFEVLSRKRKPEDDIYVDGMLWGTRIHGLDFTLFQKFVLSVLWRASVSSHAFFTKVELGPYTDKIRSYLREQSIDPAPEYAVLLFSLTGQPFRPLIITPAPVSLDGIRFYRLNFPGAVVMVKVDQQPNPYPFKQIELSSTRQNVMVFQPYSGSPEQKAWAIFRQRL
jgi:hypothetical protein